VQGIGPGVELISRVGNKVSGWVPVYSARKLNRAIFTGYSISPFSTTVDSHWTPQETWTRNWLCRSEKRDYKLAIANLFEKPHRSTTVEN